MEEKRSNVICLWPHSSKWLSWNLNPREHNSEDPIFLPLSDDIVGAKVTGFTCQNLLGCASHRKQQVPFLNSSQPFFDSTYRISLLS